MNLTKEQKNIIESKDQHIVIVANAGTGKTSTVIEKLYHFIYNEYISPDRILLTSFSRVASSELYEKACKKIGQDKADKMVIGTIHSVCFRIISENLDKVGLKALNIVNESYLSAILFNKYTDIFKDKKAAMKVTNSYRKYLLSMKSEKPKNLSISEFKAIEECQKIMEADNKIVFDDLLIKTVQLFEKYKDIHNIWKNKFDVFIIDEAQDTSKIQWTLINLLQHDKTKTTVVGDAKQNIFAFRGCSHRFMSEYKENKKAKVFSLSETFRFGQNFADLSNKIIDNLKLDNDYKKHTVTNVNCSNLPTFHKLTALEQVDFVLKDIQLKREQGFSYKDLNIIYRYNREALFFVRSFIENNIPFETKSGDIFERSELKFVLKSYSLLTNFRISDAIELFSMFPNFVGDATLTKIYNSSPFKDSILAVLDYALKNSIEGVGYKKKQSLSEIKGKLTLLNNYLHSEFNGKVSFKEIAKIMDMDNTKFMLKESEDNDTPSEDRWEFLDFFQSSFEKTIFKNPLDWFSDVQINGSKIKENEKDKIQLKTIHGCKGQSLPVVYFAASNICHKFFITSEEDIENEKYVLYVATSRAISYLHIFIDFPEAFRFNFIFPDDWKEKYVNKVENNTIVRRQSVDSSVPYSLPKDIESQLKFNYQSKKRSYRNVLLEELTPVANTLKAVQFKLGKDNSWLPISALGYNDNRYFIDEWIIKKNNLQKFIEKY